MKQSLAEEVGAAETRMSRQKSGFLCARRYKQLYTLLDNDTG